MWMLTSSALLATLLVSGLSFPHPDEGYNIPEVGTGRRAQYYVSHSDGTFKYGFDTGDGAYEKAKSPSVGSRMGAFGYRDPDGKEIKLEYTAGRGGFIAKGDHLPRVIPVISTHAAGVTGGTTKRAKPFTDPLANSDSDASYNFGFASDSHSRTEQSDSDGQVTGSYHYIDDNGLLREFNYQAGKGIGFQITGQGLTAPTTPTKPTGSSFRTRQAEVRQSYPRQHEDAIIKSVTGDNGEYSFSYSAGTHSRSETGDENLNVKGSFDFTAPDDDIRRRVEYEAGSDTGFIVEADHLPVGPSVPGAEDGKPSGQFVKYRKGKFVDPLAGSGADSSYNFGFKSDSYSRSESSDKDGNVVGSYTLVEEDGTKVKNEFRAGKGIGFEIKEVSRTAGTPLRPSFRSRKAHSKAAGTIKISSPQRTVTPVKQDVHTSYRSSFQPNNNYQDANIQTSSGDGGAYSFSYDAGTHSRSESGDRDNKVVGEFAFISQDDGVKRELEYEAGRETGFIVNADHLPVGPSVPGAEDGKPSGQFARHQKKDFVDPLASKDSDSSYNFGFESDAYTRTETSDKDGNVVGSYTLVEDDGTRVTTSFRAGKGIGFEVQDISRVPGAPLQKTAFRSRQHVQNTHGTTAQRTSAGHQQSYNPIPKTKSSFQPANIATTTGEDGEYSFSYDTGTHSRSESGDSENEVVGEFSFIAEDDGIRRKLEYEAGKETGFIVEADHLPVGPSVPGAEDGKPSGQFARYQKSEYVDPLASSGESDASYQFSFSSDSYSRSESSDKDGNIEGTFSVLDDEGTQVTSKFRAGKGIGYEVEEISRVRGAAPIRSHADINVPTQVLAATPYTAQKTTYNRKSSPVSSISTRKQTSSIGTSRKQSFSHGQRKSKTTTSHRSSQEMMKKDKPGSSVITSPEYSIYRYDAAPGAEKFGYVIQYN